MAKKEITPEPEAEKVARILGHATGYDVDPRTASLFRQLTGTGSILSQARYFYPVSSSGEDNQDNNPLFLYFPSSGKLYIPPENKDLPVRLSRARDLAQTIDRLAKREESAANRIIYNAGTGVSSLFQGDLERQGIHSAVLNKEDNEPDLRFFYKDGPDGPVIVGVQTFFISRLIYKNNEMHYDEMHHDPVIAAEVAEAKLVVQEAVARQSIDVDKGREKFQNEQKFWTSDPEAPPSVWARTVGRAAEITGKLSERVRLRAPQNRDSVTR